MNYINWLNKVLGGIIKEIRKSQNNELVIHTEAKDLKKILKFLKNSTNTQIKCLFEITSIDYPQRERRFDVVYFLLSVRYSFRLKVVVSVDSKSSLPSVTDIFRSANWFEREVYDTIGILFTEHPDLRRILTDYGFKGHPIRKDFPLTGFTEVRYDEEKKRVVTNKLELSQEFRAFKRAQSWDGQNL